MTESPGKNLNLTDNTQTPKAGTRKHSELSPEEQEIEPKKQCQEMSQIEMDLKNFMAEFRNDMAIVNQKIDELSNKFDSKLEALITDLKQVKQDIIDVRAEVLKIEEDATEAKIKYKNHHNEINALNQRMIDNHITMINIASTTDDNLFLADMKKWSGNIFNESIMDYNISSNKKYKSKAAHIRFYSLDHKKRFLKFLKTKQQDANKKFIPVMNENIFTLADSDVNRANVIDFRSPMTSINRDIFNTARKAKKNSELIDGVWISNGTVKIQIKRKKPVQVNDIEELKEILSQNKIQIPRAMSVSSPSEI